MSGFPKSYEKLLERTKQLVVLNSASAIVQWDMETKMPPKAINLRSQQLALLGVIGHRMLTDPEMGKIVSEVEKALTSNNMGAVEKRNILLVKKAYNEATKIPESLVFETEKQRTVSVGAWKKAKTVKDWKSFKPELKKMIDLRAKAAEMLMEVKDAKNPYDALIDDFEPKMKAERIRVVFDAMKNGLISILKKIDNSSVKPEVNILSRPIPIESQRLISEAAMEYVGYDTHSPDAGGRLDETEHPFTTGYYDDIRITTHYHENRWSSSLFSVLHEAGHAIYEQNLPHTWMYQPIGASSSSGIHESQSRFVENMIGRSSEFWSYFAPKLRKIVGKPLQGVNKNDLLLTANLVAPSKIRIEADEITYGLHIIIRFELERALFNGKLTIDELPNAWNQKYNDYLDVKIMDDSEGVMQDTHWASGLFGYFPSYALGNIYGGMFLKKMKRDVPDYRKNLTTGDFKPVKTWLIENIHQQGNLYDPEELVKKVTGSNLDVEPFLNYLESKYKKLYKY
jgi:carboxypeptidase Taq